ncbi:esterase-like activity of phytase family protein [Sphingomonas lenta]|uniref:Phytase-like domain-containing protein n=1 Tax=Sphingomonas lenta TaxID=1141887 RepID=A0A2A2SF26_9SPHN|nr:esterase-like activity of phytase family protein [Sphingomonas lenta]PAX07611.1 hypothetical protein CKY28_08135 [Sphingomonas lenta]
MDPHRSTAATEGVAVRITRLRFDDEPLGDVALPNGAMRLTRGLGSGLAVRPGDPPGRLWAVGDRGPNFKADLARAHGLDLPPTPRGAKIMPRLDIGPALVELELDGDAVRVRRVLPITDGEGRPIGGLPVPAGSHARAEPALGLDGRPLGTDPSGADTEGLIALRDGGFWVGDEYGPSLLRLDGTARVLVRWVPEGCEAHYAGARYPVEGRLPALAASRHINRGFEALASSPDERLLHLAFQSPLAHPDAAAHEAAQHLRLWTLDAGTGRPLAQHLYPLDPPERFRRDVAEGSFERSDIKVSELAAFADGRLVCLERGSASTKLYLVSPDGAPALPPEHLDPDTRPTVEELSARDPDMAGLPVLAKTLLLDTDDHPEIGRDLEGIALIGPNELVLVSDNDFGVEGAETGFWRVEWA